MGCSAPMHGRMDGRWVTGLGYSETLANVLEDSEASKEDSRLRTNDALVVAVVGGGWGQLLLLLHTHIHTHTNTTNIKVPYPLLPSKCTKFLGIVNKFARRVWRKQQQSKYKIFSCCLLQFLCICFLFFYCCFLLCFFRVATRQVQVILPAFSTS